MSIWTYKIDKVPGQRVSSGDQTCIVAYDFGNDYQKGDYLFFVGGGGSYLSGNWEITHVAKNQNGIADHYVVLSLKAPDADYHKQQAAELRAFNLRNARTIAALRGQITKLRKRIDGTS